MNNIDVKDTIAKVYNSLGTISVKGNDTITMANCLTALEQLYNALDEKPEAVEEKKD